MIFLILLTVPQTLWAGPVTLLGYDADDHTSIGTQPCVDLSNMKPLIDLAQNVLDNVTNGGSGILAIGADPGTEAGNWVVDLGECLSPAQTVTFVNDDSISSISFSGYAILYVPSDDNDLLDGGIVASSSSTDEYTRLNNRQDDVTAFVNGGGGVFSLTCGDPATTLESDPYGFISGVAGITVTSVAANGILPSGNDYDNVTATAPGTLLGITDTNMDSCCWHNVFPTYPDFFDVLATANEPAVGDESFNGEAAILGGVDVIIGADWGWTHRP